MFDIDALIAKLQSSDTAGKVVINVINVNKDDDVDDFIDDDDDAVATDTSTDNGPYTVQLTKEIFVETDFKVGNRVMLCHVKKDGTGTKHTDGTVDSIDIDDFGPYVRVTGDNGKHYRCGLKIYEVRKGTQIIRKL